MKAFKQLLYTGIMILSVIMGMFLALSFLGRYLLEPLYHRLLPQFMQSVQMLIAEVFILTMLLFYLAWHQRAHKQVKDQTEQEESVT